MDVSFSTTDQFTALSHTFPLFGLYLPYFHSALELLKERAHVPLSTYIPLPLLSWEPNSPSAPSLHEQLSPAFNSRSKPRSNSSMTLAQLPAELHLHITSFLSPDALLAFRLTNTYFYSLPQKLPAPSSLSLTSCQRFAIRQHLSWPSCSSSNNSATATTSRAFPTTHSADRTRRCRLCKSTYPTYMFSSNHSPACLPQHAEKRASSAEYSTGYGNCDTRGAQSVSANSNANPDVLPLPHGICAWHVGRLGRIVVLDSKASAKAKAHRTSIASGTTFSSPSSIFSSALNKPRQYSHNSAQPTKPGWYATTETMCTHCGAVWWRDGDGESESESESGGKKCDCECDACGPVTVQAYTRYLSEKEEQLGACRRWRFWRSSSGTGELWVRENGGLKGTAEERDLKVVRLG